MTFSFFGFWKPPKFSKPAQKVQPEKDAAEEKKELRLKRLRRQIQVSLSYGGAGGLKNKSIKEMTETRVDVERLRKGCFFSTDNTIYSDIARCGFYQCDNSFCQCG